MNSINQILRLTKKQVGKQTVCILQRTFPRTLADTADDELLQWIDHNKITRKEAEQIAKLEGHFVEGRLQLLLDKELDENEKIFEDD